MYASQIILSVIFIQKNISQAKKLIIIKTLSLNFTINFFPNRIHICL